MNFKVSKTLLLASGLMLCAGCTKHTLNTTVNVGESGQLATMYKYNSKDVSVVQFYFSGTDEGCKIKPANFSITSQGKTYTGENFKIKATKSPYVITEVASEMKLTNYVYVMFDGALGYSDPSAVAKVGDKANIPLNKTTEITFKW